jgi:tRNA(Ile)-lysidine synthase
LLIMSEAGTSVLPDMRSPEQAAHLFLTSLKHTSRLLIAISGGSDSIGLLVALKQALDASTFAHSLCAVTVDHGLRAASAEEALAVRALCQHLHIPHEILPWVGEKPQTGLSAAARNARYRLLAEAADTFGADALVTGHTLNDQVETIAMRAERSSEGAVGLSGMAPATLYERKLWILRPFLETTRAAIRLFLDRSGYGWIDDPSNEDRRSERVRVRERQLQPDLTAIAEAGKQRRILSARSAAWLADHAERIGEQVVRIRLDDMASGPSAEVMNALSALSAIIGGRPHRPATDALDRLAAQLAGGTDFAVTLSGCLHVRRKTDLFLTRERRGLLPLPLPAGKIGIWDGRFEITNNGGTDALVAPGPALEIAPGLPHRIGMAMRENSPQIRPFDATAYAEAPDVTVTTRLSLFDPFLPDFDLPLADKIAGLLGREPAIACPV